MSEGKNVYREQESCFYVETNIPCSVTDLKILLIADEPVSLWSSQGAVCGQKDVNSQHLGMTAPLPLSPACLIPPLSHWTCR